MRFLYKALNQLVAKNAFCDNNHLVGKQSQIMTFSCIYCLYSIKSFHRSTALQRPAGPIRTKTKRPLRLTKALESGKRDSNSRPKTGLSCASRAVFYRSLLISVAKIDAISYLRQRLLLAYLKDTIISSINLKSLGLFQP